MMRFEDDEIEDELASLDALIDFPSFRSILVVSESIF
jgi:hypothetical protein